MTCAADECDRPAWRSGYCRGHYRRRTLGHPMAELRAYGRPVVVTFWDAVFDLLDLRASDDEGWRKGRKRVETAARRAFGVRRTK